MNGQGDERRERKDGSEEAPEPGKARLCESGISRPEMRCAHHVGGAVHPGGVRGRARRNGRNGAAIPRRCVPRGRTARGLNDP
jgi:hypothetical protein